MPSTEALSYAVRGHGPFEVTEDGDRVGRYDTVDDVVYVIHGRAYARVLDHLRLTGWLGFHGGLVAFGERRVVVLGEKGTGKTTLMLRLLHDGCSVEGDEMVLPRDGRAVSLPRPFHVKPGTRVLVPEVDRVYDAL